MRIRPSDPRTILEQYESLRREALEAAPFGPRGQGLVLFLSRGMADWVAALTALALPTVPARLAVESLQDDGRHVRPAARAELTTVLAGMVLACTHPLEGGACTARAR